MIYVVIDVKMCFYCFFLRDMLPTPRTDAVDRRQDEYISSYYTRSVSARTTLDSSSEESVNSEEDYDIDIQDDNSTRYQDRDQLGKCVY